MTNSANRLNHTARALVRRLIVDGKTNTQIRRELARRRYASDVSKGLLSYYRKTVRNSTHAEAAATKAEQVRVTQSAQRHGTCVQSLVFVNEAGDEQARLCIEDGALTLMQGEQRVEVAQL